MGDRIGVQLPVREIYLGLTNHPGEFSLAIHPRVGAQGGDFLQLESKGRYC